MSADAGNFRRKPVIVEARRFDGTNESAASIQSWTGSKVSCFKLSRGFGQFVRSSRAVALIGDWVVRDGDDFYPVTPEFFERNFVEVQGD